MSGREKIDGALAIKHLIEHGSPEYPLDAKIFGIQGDVLLDVFIGADGSVEDVNVVSGHPLLAKAAIAAVKRWRYEPFVVGGRAVEVSTQVKVSFSLPVTEPVAK